MTIKNNEFLFKKEIFFLPARLGCSLRVRKGRMGQLLVFRNARLVHSKSMKELEFLTQKTVLVLDGKIIQLLDEPCSYDQFITQNVSVKEVTLTNNQFLMPGLVDTHAHAPQFAFTGSGLDLSLLDWLNRYTFPCESKFTDLQYAHSVYKQSIQTHLSNGTTTICYYGTIHLEATKLLVQLMNEIGMRGFVGKVCMDQNAPDWYCEMNDEQSLRDTLEFVNWFKQNPEITLVKPIVTPRFAISCSKPLMKGLGNIARDNGGLPIQTHLSESKGEIEFVHQLYPENKNYTSVYDECGLLTERTVLAHCVHLNEDEIELVLRKECGVSHCPTSNVTLSSGIMPTREYLNRGIKLGLGTDVAGGYSPSLVEAIRSCVGMSKMMSLLRGSGPVTLEEAFYMATSGGAKLLGLECEIGSFAIGKQFDALLVDYSHINGFIEPNCQLSDIFEKVIYLMDDRNINTVYVAGRNVSRATENN